MSLKIAETFRSLMGESTLAGLPAFFIRLAGCNLRCRYCDTSYAWEGGEERQVDALVAAARDSGLGLVLLTGGEPLLQDDIHALIRGLLAGGHEVVLETNGSLPVEGLEPRVRRVVDVKCPSSGMSHYNHWPNLPLLTFRDEVKFVVQDKKDFIFAQEVIRTYRLAGRLPVLVSPVYGEVALPEVAAWILGSGLPLRLNLQLHKYIWGPEVRGV